MPKSNEKLELPMSPDQPHDDLEKHGRNSSIVICIYTDFQPNAPRNLQAHQYRLIALGSGIILIKTAAYQSGFVYMLACAYVLAEAMDSKFENSISKINSIKP
jgi:hypothetical protein